MENFKEEWSVIEPCKLQINFTCANFDVHQKQFKLLNVK